MFPTTFKPREISHFIEGKGAFHLITCGFNSPERKAANVIERDVIINLALSVLTNLLD